MLPHPGKRPRSIPQREDSLTKTKNPPTSAEIDGCNGNRQMKTPSQNLRSAQVRLLKETTENWELYRPTSESDEEFTKLRQSIAEKGFLIEGAITISSDWFVISGHRRLRAAKEQGLQVIPTFVREDIVMEELSKHERMKLLADYNRGSRIKTTAELFMEEAVQIDPEEAIREAQERKAQHFTKAKTCGVEVQSIGKIRRTDPSNQRKEFMDAVLDIIHTWRERVGNIPISERHIHYQLFSKNVRTSSGAAGKIYGVQYYWEQGPKKGQPKGDRGEDALSKLLTDARSAGIIPNDWIDDTTRPSWVPDASSLSQYLVDETDGLFQSYWGNIHREQPFHVELLLEKNTLFSLVRNTVANPLRLPLTCLRGYGSYPAARDVAARFKGSGKEKLIAVYISDLDPEGINMPASWKKYLLHDFGVDATVIRAAVTPEQVKTYNLPPDTSVKLTSSRAPSFIREYGDQCWELDSMPPQILVEEITKAAKGYLDIDILNAALEQENQDEVRLAAFAKMIKDFTKAKCSEFFGEAA